MNIYINWFRVEALPSVLRLPSVTVPDWESSREIVDHMTKKGYHVYRISCDDGVIVVSCFGPQPPSDWAPAAFAPDGARPLFCHLIDESLAKYFERRGLDVTRTRFGVQAFARHDPIADDLISARAGIVLKSSHFGSAYGVAIDWKVGVSFVPTLEDPRLDPIVTNASVVVAAEAAKEEELTGLLGEPGRYVGVVTSLLRSTRALVRCRDGQERAIERRQLRLEPTPRNVRRYERQVAKDKGSQRLWHRIQELSYSLDSNHKRNLLVLRDRMDAIRKLVVPDYESAARVPLCAYGENAFNLIMSPSRVKVTGNV